MIKKLMSCIGEYKKDSILSPVFVTIEVVFEVIVPILMAILIDDGIEKGNMNVILGIGAALVGCTVLSLLAGVLSGAYAAKASAGFGKNLRRKMFDNVQKFSFFNIDRISTSSLVTRLTTDVTNVQNAYQMIIRIAVRSPAMLIFALIMAFRMNSTLALVFLVTIPVLAIGLYFIISHAHPIFERVFKTYDRLNNVVQENVRGIRVVKSFVREEHEKEKFNKVSDSIFKDFSKAERLLALNSPLLQSCVYFCIVMISWLGANFIVSGSMTTGELTSFITYIMQIMMSLMMLSMIFVMIVISRASVERIVEVIDEKSDIVNKENALMDVPDGSIDFNHVNFSYAKRSDKLCLSDIDFHIKSGQTVGILGGTGSSKSSLVQLIPRLYDVTEGSVSVGGNDVRNYDIETLRDAVAMVLQKNVLFSGTIYENLRWGNPEATDEEVRHACVLAQADSFIQEFPEKYETYIEQGGTNVSGGQKQRLCIARALLKKPKILILDDSTSAVDTKTDAMIRKAFREEIPDTTKIIIAQRIASVMEADVIIVMNNGQINSIGTHEELLANDPIYREVYESQIGGNEDEN